MEQFCPYLWFPQAAKVIWGTHRESSNLCPVSHWWRASPPTVWVKSYTAKYTKRRYIIDRLIYCNISIHITDSHFILLTSAHSLRYPLLSLSLRQALIICLSLQWDLIVSHSGKPDYYSHSLQQGVMTTHSRYRTVLSILVYTREMNTTRCCDHIVHWRTDHTADHMLHPSDPRCSLRQEHVASNKVNIITIYYQYQILTHYDRNSLLNTEHTWCHVADTETHIVRHVQTIIFYRLTFAERRLVVGLALQAASVGVSARLIARTPAAALPAVVSVSPRDTSCRDKDVHPSDNSQDIQPPTQPSAIRFWGLD